MNSNLPDIFELQESVTAITDVGFNFGEDYINDYNQASSNNSTLANSTVLPQYFDILEKSIGSVLVSVIFVIGFIGNVMVVTVVGRTKSMHTPTNCYLVSLAVADILLLVTAPLPTIIEYFLIIGQSIYGPVGCSVMVFSQYLGVNVSVLSISAFTIER